MVTANNVFPGIKLQMDMDVPGMAATSQRNTSIQVNIRQLRRKMLDIKPHRYG